MNKMDRYCCLRVTFAVLTLFYSTFSYSDAAICFDCKNLNDSAACKDFSPCGDGLICYKETVETDTGDPLYNWGCASTVLCTLENSSVGNKKKRVSIERCFECCGDDFCNFGACTRDFCSSITCKNGASCRNTAVKGICDCVLGYTGKNCETEIDECEGSPCQNGATCNDFIGYFNCSCPAGYTGNLCETNIDECMSDPCFNNATCIDDVNMYTCNCAPGFNGTFCETDINECEPDPCHYNSTCVDLVNDYTCLCEPGTTGRDCEINIDECANVTCQNGGTCKDYINDYDCLCTLGLTGQFCETSLGRVCYECDDAESIENCTQEILCSENEECYIEHELLAPGDVNFNLGCVPSAMCSILQSGPAGRSTRPIQLCYECCDYNGCNHHACQDTVGNFTG